MSTQSLINVLKSRRDIVRIELEKETNCKDFWIQIVRSVYSDTSDAQLYDVMRAFGRTDDDMEVVNKQGKIVKRFAKFYKTETGEKLTDELAGKIGDKIQNYLKKNQVFYADFTDNFDWDDGQFGHHGSCWWGMYRESLPTFQDGGGWCIRFYNDENQNDNNGIGRTWVYPKDNILMCFNSYGVERAQTAQVIKQIFKDSGLELSFQWANVENSNSGTIPYINGGTGFAMYENEDDFQPYCDLDMEVEESNCTTCEGCGDRIDEDEGFYAEDSDWCESCYCERFSSCDRCGESFRNEDVHEVHGSRRYSYLCQDCLEHENFAECSHCGNYVQDYDIADDSGDVFCEECASDKLFHCDECGESFEYSDECPSCEKPEDEDTDSETEGNESAPFLFNGKFIASNSVVQTEAGLTIVNLQQAYRAFDGRKIEKLFALIPPCGLYFGQTNRLEVAQDRLEAMKTIINWNTIQTVEDWQAVPQSTKDILRGLL